MARKRKIIGEGFGKNIFDRSGVLRKDVASHGNVFSGELADQALDAVGARAMTMDGELSSTYSDLAIQPIKLSMLTNSITRLVQVSAGDKIHAEEIAARAIESMVFHQAVEVKRCSTHQYESFPAAENPAKPSATEGENERNCNAAFENGDPSATWLSGSSGAGHDPW